MFNRIISFNHLYRNGNLDFQRGGLSISYLWLIFLPEVTHLNYLVLVYLDWKALGFEP